MLGWFGAFNCEGLFDGVGHVWTWLLSWLASPSPPDTKVTLRDFLPKKARMIYEKTHGKEIIACLAISDPEFNIISNLLLNPFGQELGCSLIESESAMINNQEYLQSLPRRGLFFSDPWRKFCRRVIDLKILGTLLDLCVSSLRRGHANLLCIVPILSDDPRRESFSKPSFWVSSRFRECTKKFNDPLTKTPAPVDVRMIPKMSSVNGYYAT